VRFGVNSAQIGEAMFCTDSSLISVEGGSNITVTNSNNGEYVHTENHCTVIFVEGMDIYAIVVVRAYISGKTRMFRVTSVM